MKRHITFLLLLFLIQSIFAQNIGDAFYVYRNDGRFNIMYRSEVDSMGYSYYDVDSILHDHEVTQVVYTKDSVYRIPINAIDSISFVTPTTIYKPRVVVIDDELRPYVTSQNSMVLVLSTDTPKKIIPRIGEKLVTTTMDEIFPIGFAGEVESVETIAEGTLVRCSSVLLSDIFERYFGVSNKSLSPSNSQTRTVEGDIGNDENVIFSPGVLKYNLLHGLTIPDGWSTSFESKSGLAVSFSELNSEIGVSFVPVFRGRADIVVSPQTGVYTCFSLVGDFHFEEDLSLSGKIEASKNFPLWYSPPVLIPYTPLVFFNIEIGGFVKASCEAACVQKWRQDYRSYFFWEYSSKGERNLNPQNQMFPKEKSTAHEGIAFVKGNIGAGLYVEIGIDLLVKDIASARLREEMGLDYSNNYVLTKEDLEFGKKSTATYEKLRDSRWILSLLTQLSFNANVLQYGISHDINAPLVNNRKELLSGCHVPTIEEFSSNNIRPEVDGKCLYSAKISGKCNPVDISFILFDEDGKQISWFEEYWLTNYTGKKEESKSGGVINIPHTVNGIYHELEAGHVYTAYPQITLYRNGYAWEKILASPSAKMVLYTIQCPDNNHPHAIDLGLPSGTKWACCNIGAPSPIEAGGYYAWGEIKEKNDYRPGNYLFSRKNKYNLPWIVNDKEDGEYYYYMDIGNNISGTQYDAATILWGDEWCMPTSEQCKELKEYAIKGLYRGKTPNDDANNYPLLNNYFVFCSSDKAHALIFPLQGYREYYDIIKQDRQNNYISSTWLSTSLGLTDSLYDCEHYGHAYAWPIDNNYANKHIGLPIRPIMKR